MRRPSVTRDAAHTGSGGGHFGAVHVAKSCHLVIGGGQRLDAVVRGVGEAIGAAGRIDEFRDKTVAAVARWDR